MSTHKHIHWQIRRRLWCRRCRHHRRLYEWNQAFVKPMIPTTTTTKPWPTHKRNYLFQQNGISYKSLVCFIQCSSSSISLSSSLSLHTIVSVWVCVCISMGFVHLHSIFLLSLYISLSHFNSSSVGDCSCLPAKCCSSTSEMARSMRSPYSYCILYLDCWDGPSCICFCERFSLSSFLSSCVCVCVLGFGPRKIKIRTLQRVAGYLHFQWN